MTASTAQRIDAATLAPVPYVDNRELHHPARLARLLEGAERILESEKTSTADESTLFKAMHGCGYALSLGARKGRLTKQQARTWHSLRQRIRERLVNQHIGLVYEMRRRARLTDVDPDEINSDGFLTLLQSITHFDPWRGFRFSTYACTSLIRAYLLLAHRSRRTAANLNRLRDEALAAEDRREPVDHTASLLVDRLRKMLAENSADLTAAERFVIERRLLNPPDGSPQTLASIGELFHLSKERVRQIQMGALQKLRATLATDPTISGLLPREAMVGIGVDGEEDDGSSVLAEVDRRLHWG